MLKQSKNKKKHEKKDQLKSHDHNRSWSFQFLRGSKHNDVIIGRPHIASIGSTCLITNSDRVQSPIYPWLQLIIQCKVQFNWDTDNWLYTPFTMPALNILSFWEIKQGHTLIRSRQFQKIYQNFDFQILLLCSFNFYFYYELFEYVLTSCPAVQLDSHTDYKHT